MGPDRKVRFGIPGPASTGRNFDQCLRVIESLQLTHDYRVATPANWQHGDDVIIVAAASDAEADEAFPKGYHKLKPYLPVTPQPNLPYPPASESPWIA